MSFNSCIFGAFLVVVLALHRLLPWRVGRVMLVVASYFFYGFANPHYCFLLLTSTVVDFVAARRIAASSTPRSGKAWLALSVVVNLGLLGWFKYADFSIENLNVVAGWLGWDPISQLGWALPIGISFYTFQTMSYTIDVYQGKVEPTKDFFGFALYVSFFPQLLAGPIERMTTLLPQLLVKQQVTRRDREVGFQRALWGLFKKLVVADRLAVFVDSVYADPGAVGSAGLALGAACFWMQIYLDFSGYTDIALGVARMMGVRLRENFQWPLLARNPADFWGRWHISLTSWFRDYLFTALVGRKRPTVVRQFFILVVVGVLIGLWHGAGWSFVVMGVVAAVAMGSYQATFTLLKRPRNRPLFGKSPWAVPIAVVLMNLWTMGMLVLFRAKSLDQAGDVYGGILAGDWSWEPHYWLYLGICLAVWLVSAVGRWKLADREDVPLPPPVRAALWIVLSLLILYGAVDTTEQFIYFQF